MSLEPAFLVIDGYYRAGREELAAGGASSGGQLYERMLKRCHPGCSVDIIYPADPGVALPAGAALARLGGVGIGGITFRGSFVPKAQSERRGAVISWLAAESERKKEPEHWK